jgi:hypothetical protein
MAENDKHMIDLNIKELQETKKVINKKKKLLAEEEMRVSGGGGDEPYIPTLWRLWILRCWRL